MAMRATPLREHNGDMKSPGGGTYAVTSFANFAAAAELAAARAAAASGSSTFVSEPSSSSSDDTMRLLCPPANRCSDSPAAAAACSLALCACLSAASARILRGSGGASAVNGSNLGTSTRHHVTLDSASSTSVCGVQPHQRTYIPCHPTAMPDSTAMRAKCTMSISLPATGLSSGCTGG